MEFFGIIPIVTLQKSFRNIKKLHCVNLATSYAIEHLSDVFDKVIPAETPPRTLRQLNGLLLTSWPQIPKVK